MKKRVFYIIVTVLLVGFLSGCGPKPAAEVNGQKISQDQFNRYFEQVKVNAQQMGTSFEGEQGEKLLKELKKKAIDNLVDETLILQDAEKENISVSQKDIDEFLNQTKKTSFENTQKYQEWLTSMKMTEAELKEKIKFRLVGQKLFDKITTKVKVTDTMVRDFYERDKNQWQKIKVSHILIDVNRNKASKTELGQARNKALEIIKELDNGADFGKLAREYSKDPGSASQGGALDMEFSRNEQELVPEFVEGSFKLKNVGEYSKEPVLSDFGYHIIKLDAKKDSFKDVQNDIKDYLLQEKKNEKFTEFIESLRKSAKITKNI